MQNLTPRQHVGDHILFHITWRRRATFRQPTIHWALTMTTPSSPLLQKGLRVRLFWSAPQLDLADLNTAIALRHRAKEPDWDSVTNHFWSGSLLAWTWYKLILTLLMYWLIYNQSWQGVQKRRLGHYIWNYDMVSRTEPPLCICLSWCPP